MAFLLHLVFALLLLVNYKRDQHVLNCHKQYSHLNEITERKITSSEITWCTIFRCLIPSPAIMKLHVTSSLEKMSEVANHRPSK